MELKQYQRNNPGKDHSSSIFVSIHMGSQIVLWEVTNYPKVKMKMIWFYVIGENR